MEKLFLIGAAGFVALSFYNFRLKKNYAESNSNKFLINVVIWGTLPYILLIAIKQFARKNEYFVSYFTTHQEHLFPTEIIATVILSTIIGIAFSMDTSQKIKNWISSLLELSSVDPQTTGLIEYDWLRFFKSEETLIFTLKNNKVYVGILLFADIKDNMPQDQRAIRITPLKSGHRDLNGKVIYDTFYFTPDQIDLGKSEEDIAKMTEEELTKLFNPEIEKQYIQAISSIEDLVLFQREIVSYTIYSTELDDRFYGSPTKDETNLIDSL